MLCEGLVGEVDGCGGDFFCRLTPILRLLLLAVVVEELLRLFVLRVDPILPPLSLFASSISFSSSLYCPDPSSESTTIPSPPPSTSSPSSQPIKSSTSQRCFPTVPPTIDRTDAAAPRISSITAITSPPLPIQCPTPNEPIIPNIQQSNRSAILTVDAKCSNLPIRCLVMRMMRVRSVP